MCVKYLLEKYWGSGKQKNMKRSDWPVLNVFKISSYFLSKLSHSKLFSFSFFFLTRKTCEINPADVRNIPSSVFRFDNTYKHVSFKHRADVEKTHSRIFKQVKAVTSWVNARKRAKEKRKRERKKKKSCAPCCVINTRHLLCWKREERFCIQMLCCGAHLFVSAVFEGSHFKK